MAKKADVDRIWTAWLQRQKRPDLCRLTEHRRKLLARALDDLLARLSPVDLVLIEGYKRAPHPKVEAFRAATGRALLARDNPTIRAVASDTALPDCPCAVFDLDDTAAVAGFILGEVGL